jgi:hypothetical protein
LTHAAYSRTAGQSRNAALLRKLANQLSKVEGIVHLEIRGAGDPPLVVRIIKPDVAYMHGTRALVETAELDLSLFFD